MQQMIQKAITKTGLSLLLSVFSYVSLTHAGTPFTTDGNFSVGNDGSANYSIPIQVPPGTAGMAPTLSLNYNSNGGNGMLGMGWGIDGLSQISRCPQTLVQDGQVRGVSYDQNDKLCLDGQRLISTGGTYGANGTEYRAEQANFARIISYTSDINNGPDSFKVWTKAGQVIEYGNTADSRIEAAGKTVIRSWATNKISDTKGNYISVSYTEDNANGEAYVNRIDYTGNSNTGLAPYANVQFEYEDRPDISIAYQAGSIIKSTKRMTNIKTYTNNTTLVKDYKLNYIPNTTALPASRLEFVQECDGANNCKLPVNMQYPSIGDGTFEPIIVNVPTSTTDFESAHKMQFADVNGDGKTDALITYVGTAGLRIRVMLSNGDGTFGPIIVNVPTSTTDFGSAHKMQFADVNGDGKTDALVTYVGTAGLRIRVMLSNGDGTFGPIIVNVPTSTTDFGSAHKMQFADVNGDGKTDALVTYVGTAGLRIRVMLSNGDGTFGPIIVNVPTSTTDFGSAHQMQLADVNGDGKTDALVTYVGTAGLRIRVMLSNGDGTFGPIIVNVPTSTTDFGSAHQMQLADVNGDGKMDALVTYVGTAGLRIRVMLSNGDGTFAPIVVSAPSATNFGSAGAHQMQLADVNGDGKTDALVTYVGTAGIRIRVMLSNGDGTFAPIVVSAPSATNFGSAGAHQMQLADVNGDGKTDALVTYVGTAGIRIRVMHAPKGNQFSATSFTPGLSSNISLTYKPITDSSVYVKGAAGASGTTECPMPLGEDGTTNSYPILNLQAPMYVVSSASVSDGNSGTLTNTYQYGGLKAHLKGRGSLGFRYQQVTQTDADINSTTFFRQDYPYIGLPCQTEKRVTSTNTLIGASALSYANAPKSEGSATSQFPYLTQSVEQSFELDGSLINTTTKTNQFDDYGNATQIGVDSGDGYTKTTNNEYYNDTSNGKWLLGRLLKSSVTSTSPDTAPTLPGGGGGTPPPATNVAPSVSITNPPNGISVPGPVDVQITADASDSDGTIAEVAFYANGNLLGTDTTAPYAVDVTGVQAGNYTVTATATDDDGATTSVSVQVTVN